MLLKFAARAMHVKAGARMSRPNCRLTKYGTRSAKDNALHNKLVIEHLTLHSCMISSGGLNGGQRTHRDKELVLLASGQGTAHGHGLSSCCRLVQQRGVRQLHTQIFSAMVAFTSRAGISRAKHRLCSAASHQPESIAHPQEWQRSGHSQADAVCAIGAQNTLDSAKAACKLLQWDTLMAAVRRQGCAPACL